MVGAEDQLSVVVGAEDQLSVVVGAEDQLIRREKAD